MELSVAPSENVWVAQLLRRNTVLNIHQVKSKSALAYCSFFATFVPITQLKSHSSSSASTQLQSG